MKQLRRCADADDGESPPTRGRGLKRAADMRAAAVGGVAPHAGAWVETGEAR